MSLGARDYWMKPLTIDKLRKNLPRALRHAQANRARSARHQVRARSNKRSSSRATWAASRCAPSLI